MVVLYSRFTRFSTIFTFQLSASPVNLPTSVSDPYILPLDEKKEGDSSASLDYSHRESHSICNLELKAVRYKARDKSNQSELGSRYRECGIRFFQLTLLYSNLHLRQCLYAGFPAAQSIHVQSPQIQRCARLFKNPAKVIDYDFIVPNRYPIENREHLACGSSPQRIDQKESGAEASVSEEDPWTLNFEWLKNEIERNTFKSTDLGGPPFSTFAPLEQCLDLMGSAILDKLENRTPGLISLSVNYLHFQIEHC